MRLADFVFYCCSCFLVVVGIDVQVLQMRVYSIREVGTFGGGAGDERKKRERWVGKEGEECWTLQKQAPGGK